MSIVVSGLIGLIMSQGGGGGRMASDLSLRPLKSHGFGYNLTVSQ